MCYNVAIYTDVEALERRFGAKFLHPDYFEPRYHASAFTAPYLPVISGDDIHAIQFFRWGLVPHWVEDGETAEKIRMKTLNARSETIHEKPSFKHAIRDRRCLVLVDGFYEWREFKGKKYPYHIRLVDHAPFALAGIWDSWKNGGTAVVEMTFSIITTRANPLLEQIHNTRKRMPVILETDDEGRWLDKNLSTEGIDSLLLPFDDTRMEAHTVSKLITARGRSTNVPEVMDEYLYPELEPLGGDADQR
jgi:putative SOS response-associated peptidase YedK